MRRKAIVAMSGGVDSSVSAALLIEEGFDVTGVMLKLWKGEAANTASGCCNVDAAEDARRVADVLGIRFYVWNLADAFETSVIQDFHQQYARGRTPNPCVRCNQWIKFDALLSRARGLGAEVLATGHYARVAATDDGYRLYRGRDRNKDQSYVLWMLTQEDLAHCRFPIGEMHKSETRALAGRLGLRTAEKPDSQEICFVRAGDVGAYVDANIADGARPGAILDPSGRRVGEHRGIGHYTVGQRKGLGLSLGAPVFVTSIDSASNSIRIGARDDLRVGGFSVGECSFVGQIPAVGERVLVQHRAHGETDPATLHLVGSDEVRVVYDRPVEAVAPGQSAALYAADDPDRLVGGGVITTTTPAAGSAVA